MFTYEVSLQLDGVLTLIVCYVCWSQDYSQIQYSQPRPPWNRHNFPRACRQDRRPCEEAHEAVKACNDRSSPSGTWARSREAYHCDKGAHSNAHPSDVGSDGHLRGRTREDACKLPTKMPNTHFRYQWYLQMVDALAKWPESEEPQHSVCTALLSGEKAVPLI